jgi:O-antigen/teichoic acid export membrane protein
MKKDLIITCISYAFSFLCGIIVYRLAAKGFGPMGFGEYALARRAVSFMQPVLLMGLGVGLPRYIAISTVKRDEGRSQASYIVAGYGSVLLFSLLILAVANLVPGLLGRAVFGKPGYEDHVRIIALLSESYIVGSLVFAYYRGNGKFLAANVITALTQGVVPLTAFLFFSTVRATLVVTALGIFAVALVFSLPVIREVLTNLKEIEWVNPLKDLLRYGLARVPGDISMAGFLALPAFLTSNLFGVKEAGYVAFGLSMVSVIGSVFQPIGLITLPKMSSILSEGRHDEARVIMQKIIAYTALISIGITIALYLSAGYIVHYWLGPQFDEATGIARVAMLAAVPNALFIALRSSIDAAHVKAINAGNIYRALLVSLAAYLVVIAGHMNITGIPLSFLLGMVVLCFLTLKVSLSTYGLSLKWGLSGNRS